MRIWRAIAAQRKALDRMSGNCADLGALTAVLMTSFGIVQLFMGSWMLGLIELGMAALAIGATAWVLAGKPANVAGHGLAGMLTLTALGINVASGGHTPGAVIGIPVLMMLILILLEGWSAGFWLLVSAVQIPLAWFLSRLPVAYPLTVDPVMAELAVFRVPFGFTLMGIMVGLTYRHSMNLYRREAEHGAADWENEMKNARLEEERLKDFAEIGADVLWETDSKLRLTGVSRGFERIFRVPEEECLKRTPAQVYDRFGDPGDDYELYMEPMRSHRPFSDQQLRWRIEGGSVMTLRNSGRPVMENGRFMGYRGVMKDITEVVELRRRLHLEASTDALTGLLNRTAFSDALNQVVLEAIRTPSQGLAVALLDLDDFKQVNDQGGHDVGDEMLMLVADAINITRIVAGRLGGDEFAAFFLVSCSEEADTIARRLLSNVESIRFLKSGHAYRVRASIGLYTECPVTTTDVPSWLGHADQASYQAKRSGKGRLETSNQQAG